MSEEMKVLREKLLSANKIIRPAYKSLGGTHDYIPRSQRA